MEKTVVALFDNLDTAQTAVQELLDNGFSRDDISVVRTNQQRDYTSGNLAEDDADASSAAAGAGIGAVLGGLAGLLVGLGALAIPGIGPIVAAGPLATTLAGAGLGAATGGLVGALADAGMPQEEAGAYAEGVRRGGTLVTVRCDESEVVRATEILNRFTPVDINQRAATWDSSTSSGYDASAGPYSTATGAPHTQQADDMPAGSYQAGMGMAGESGAADDESTGSTGYTGSGTVYGGGSSYSGNIDRPNASDISESPDRVGSTTRSDEDRMLRSGHGEMSPSQGLSAGEGGTYERMQEEDRTVHPRSSEGDYQARRDFLGGPETEDDYHRDESAAIQTGQAAYDNQGQAVERPETPSSQGHAMEGQYGGHQGSLAGGQSFTGVSPRRFEDYDADFRSDWDATYRSTGLDYSRYQPAYQYGWQLGEQYEGQAWNDFEANARADWERSHPDDAWQDFKDAVRRGWDRFRSSTQRARESSFPSGYEPEHQDYRAGQGHDQTLSGMSRSFDVYDREFRSDWERLYRSSGYGYERYQPAYMYGYNLATEPRYQGRKWNEIESDARRDWETRHPNDAWEHFKEAVHHAWNRIRGEGDTQY